MLRSVIGIADRLRARKQPAACGRLQAGPNPEALHHARDAVDRSGRTAGTLEADGKLRIPLDVWKKSVWMAGKTPRGEAYGESVVTEIFLRGGSVCAEAIWRRFDTPGHEDQRSLGG